MPKIQKTKSNCSVCGAPNSKAFLFMPSNEWAFLCKECLCHRLLSPQLPIRDWLETAKYLHEEKVSNGGKNGM